MLSNQGNASYRTVAYGPCLDRKTQAQCKETYYDLPGKQRRFKKVDMQDPQSHLGLWLGQEFVVVK